jgi:hypothetical protein
MEHYALIYTVEFYANAPTSVIESRAALRLFKHLFILEHSLLTQPEIGPAPSYRGPAQLLYKTYKLHSFQVQPQIP